MDIKLCENVDTELCENMDIELCENMDIKLCENMDTDPEHIRSHWGPRPTQPEPALTPALALHTLALSRLSHLFFRQSSKTTSLIKCISQAHNCSSPLVSLRSIP